MIVARGRTPQSIPRALAAAGALLLLLIGAALSSIAAAPAAAAPIRIVSTYPPNGADRVAPEAELHVVFDQPTAKSGIFSVADFDSGAFGVILALEAPRWSASGDTVYLKPTSPMQYGHRHAIQVQTILAPDPLNNGGPYPIIYFNVAPRANVVRIGPPDLFASVTLVPGVATPITVGVRETAGTAAFFTRARYRFYAGERFDLTGSFLIAPIEQGETSVSLRIPRLGTAQFTVPVTLSRNAARAAGRGPLGVELTLEGYDETGLPTVFSVTSRIGTTPSLINSTLFLTRGQVTPALGAQIAIGSVFLESPLPGTTVAAGDTIRPRAVVTGIGTGPFRGAFILDDEVVALVEGFLESGRPDTVVARGPIPTRRLGEHRLQFVVEAPQRIAAAPVTFLCVPPPAGLSPVRGGSPPDPPALGVAPPTTTFDLTWLATGATKYRGDEGSANGWAAWRGGTNLGGGARLEANGTWRVRFDDTKNGSVSPEQAVVRLLAKRTTIEWGDVAPSLAAGAPLLASSVPRRAAQATLRGLGLGTLETYVALEAHPRSAGGPAREARSDLYAARLARDVGKRLRLSAYGGYTHEDPTAGGAETATRARAIYGGSGSATLGRTWRWSADVATVRHRAIEGVETGRSRTGLRSEFAGKLAGADLRAEGFRYQPDLATELNPYAISDRQGGALSAAYDIKGFWRVFGDCRFEEPVERLGPMPTPFGPLGGVPYLSAQRLALGTRVSLAGGAYVTPVLIRIRHRGDQTDFTETRLSSEFSAPEMQGGRTFGR
ncbi:MAG TPA: Ig-like domain-containing protein, partial [Candidatus Eisenbacteria bacterium]|nr:Ig-like domain-containing protein [Candidatus Eisenbacteria bacterium]